MRDETCLWCNGLAVRWCDAWLGCVPVMEGKRECISLDGPHFNCDAPMCEDHATRAGHFCAGKDTDSIDHCPAHRDIAHMKDWPNVPKTAGAAERVRGNIRAEARRTHMRILQGGA